MNDSVVPRNCSSFCIDIFGYRQFVQYYDYYNDSLLLGKYTLTFFIVDFRWDLDMHMTKGPKHAVPSHTKYDFTSLGALTTTLHAYYTLVAPPQKDARLFVFTSNGNFGERNNTWL